MDMVILSFCYGVLIGAMFAGMVIAFGLGLLLWKWAWEILG